MRSMALVLLLLAGCDGPHQLWIAPGAGGIGLRLADSEPHTF